MPEKETGDRISNIITFVDDKYNEVLSVSQWKTHLILRTSKDNGAAEVGAKDILKKGQPIFMAVSSDEKATKVILNGAKTLSYQGFKPEKLKDITGIVLANAPTGQRQWEGNLYYLALYSGTSKTEFKFSEGWGNLIESDTKDLRIFIPSDFRVLKRTVLLSPLKGFRPDRHYFFDILVNITGFLFYGFFVALSFKNSAPEVPYRKIYFYTALSGTAISLFIELTQVFMPERNSSLTDLICNSVGTILGIIFLHYYLPPSASAAWADE
ncbi:MAG: VanZ family protein [Deltaproteobacteria bacterium]|nr:VanZ family protein [Deltaproteobacteria bacterium]